MSSIFSIKIFLTIFVSLEVQRLRTHRKKSKDLESKTRDRLDLKGAVTLRSTLAPQQAVSWPTCSQAEPGWISDNSVGVTLPLWFVAGAQSCLSSLPPYSAHAKEEKIAPEIWQLPQGQRNTLWKFLAFKQISQLQSWIPDRNLLFLSPSS